MVRNTIEQYLYGYDLTVTDSTLQLRGLYIQVLLTTQVLFLHIWILQIVYLIMAVGVALAVKKFMPKPCMLNYDGTVAYYLNPMDYSKRWTELFAI